MGKTEGKRRGWQKMKWLDALVGWHHWFNGHKFEQTPGDSEGQGSLACCSLWGFKEVNTTEQLNNNKGSECNCAVVWTFFGITFLRDWNENWPFPVLWPLLSFPNLLASWVQHFNSIIFYCLSSAVLLSPPLALFIVMLPKALDFTLQNVWYRWVITPLWLSGSLRHNSSVYSFHFFLISSVSVRSIPFLSFIVPVFAWNVPLVSLIFLKRSLVFPILLFSFISLPCSLKKAFISLLFFGTLYSGGYIFPFLLCLSRLFLSQLFVRPSQTTILLAAFRFLGDGFVHCLLYNVANFCPKSSGTLSCSVMFDSATPWTKTHQATPSMGFSRQEYWSGLPLPSPKFIFLFVEL